MSTQSPNRTANRSHDSSPNRSVTGSRRSSSGAASRGSLNKSEVYPTIRPRTRTNLSSSRLSSVPSNFSGRRSRRSSCGSSCSGSCSRSHSSSSSGGSSSSSSSSSGEAASVQAYSDVDPLDLGAVLVRAAGEEPHRVIDLLKDGANPHARSKRLSLTLMHRLVINSKVSPELLKRIIRHLDEEDVKTLVSAGNSFNITPLHFTVSHNLQNAAKIAEILLEHGADPAAIEGNDLKRQPLHIAALKGGKECVDVLLKHKDRIDLDYRDSGESTALDNACWQGHTEIVQVLYEAGADIHTRDDHGWTPLRSAAQYGHVDIVNFLLDKGADIRSQDNEGLTSLHAAARDREIPVVETLLRRGAYVNARDTYGCTPLDLMAWKDHDDVAKILLDNGAAVEVCDYEGLTPLMTAAEFGSEKMVKFLLANGGDIHRTSVVGLTALDKANPAKGRAMHYLIMQGAYSDVPTEDGFTPLMTCVVRGYKDAVELLVEGGADLRRKDSAGFSSLIKAASSEAVEIVEWLLDNHLERLDINAQNHKGETALMYAVDTGNEELVLKLLKAGASLQALDSFVGTCLHHAATWGLANIAALLLDFGAHVDAVNIEQETPLSTLCRTPPDLEMMKQYSGSSDDEGIPKPWLRERAPVVSRRWKETLQILLRYGANPNWTNKTNQHPLHHAARWNEPIRLRLLVDLLPPDALYLLNDKEATPLSVALYHKNPLSAKLLLNEMRIADFGPHLGLDHEHKYLVWAAGSLDTHIIAMLLFVKSTKFVFDPARMSWSAMDWAAYRGLPEVLWALLCSVEDTAETARQRKSAMRIAKQLRKAAGLGERRLPPKASSPKPDDKDGDRHRNKPKGVEPGKKGQKPREPQEKLVDPATAGDNEYEEPPQSPVAMSPTDKARNAKEGWPTPQSEEIEEPTSKKQKAGKHQDSTKEKGQKGYKDDKWGLIVDMLRDPPPIKTSGPTEPFEKPTGEGQLDNTLEDYEAAIVDFYAGDGGTGFLRRFRSLRETIYELGPHEIMKQARETMQYVNSEIGSKDDETRQEQQKTYTRDDLQFTWIHLPANNMKWMNDLLLRIYTERGEQHENSFREMNSFMRKSWTQTPDRVSRTRFMRPQCVTDYDSDHRGRQKGVSGMANSPMALYIPYLTFSTEYKREIISNHRARYNSLLEQYYDSVIHGSRTLDEFYYHFSSETRLFQEDMRRRNLDQVVTKEIHGDLENLQHFTAVRVDQVWLWMLDNKTLITSSTHRIDGGDDHLFTGIIDLLTKGTERSKSRFAQPRDALEMSQIIVNFCVGCFDRQPKPEPQSLFRGSIRQIFSDSINKTAIEEADLFRRYTQEQLAEKNGQKPKNRRRREAVGTAAELFRRIKDIRDELNILKALAEAQDGVQSALMYYRDRDMQKARSVVKDIIELDEIAKRLQNSISTTLSLEQNDTAITQSQESVRQGRTLMVFTVVTLLFLPMSFLTSLFALDTESFLKTPKWAFAVIFCVSMGLVVPLASYAFYSETIMDWIYKVWPSKADVLSKTERDDMKALVRTRSVASLQTIDTVGADSAVTGQAHVKFRDTQLDDKIKPIYRQPTVEIKQLRLRDGMRGADVPWNKSEMQD